MRPIISSLTLGVVSLLAVARPLPTSAQAPPIEPATRVRVTISDHGIRHVGALRAVDGDTLVLDTLRLARTAITRLEVSRGRKGHAVLGAVIGAVTLGVVGAVGGAAYSQIPDYPDDVTETAALGGGAGLVLGGLIGAGVGALIKSDRWEEASFDQLHVSFMRWPGGPLGLSLRLAVRF
jgi:hypothetical protein